MRRVLIVVLSVILSACAAARGPSAAITPHPGSELAKAGPPRLAEGLWAILDPGCPKPSGPNFHIWPRCASPFWISRDKAVVVRSAPAAGAAKPALVDRSYAADYSLTPGDPVIAQVGDEKAGYLFLALTELSKDGQGQLIAATGAAVACPTPLDGAVSFRPDLNGCSKQSLEAVRRAATLTLQDRTALSHVAWIAAGAP